MLLSLIPLAFALPSLAAPTPPPTPRGIAVVNSRSWIAPRAGGPINNINITVTSPAIQCQTVDIAFFGGVEPYTLKIGTGGWYVENSTWLYEWNGLEEGVREWTVNASVGDALNFQVWDAKEDTKNVQGVVVQEGSDCCLRREVEVEVEVEENQDIHRIPS